jgi:small conductance mechanosensitive channel
VIIPNAQITSGTITNVTARDKRRIDLTASCSYDDDLDKVESIIHDILSKEERILADPEPTVGLVEMGDSAIVYNVRPWVATADYWPVYYALNKAIKQRFDKENITIPFPQMDVHLKKDE